MFSCKILKKDFSLASVSDSYFEFGSGGWEQQKNATKIKLLLINSVFHLSGQKIKRFNVIEDK